MTPPQDSTRTQSAKGKLLLSLVILLSSFAIAQTPEGNRIAHSRARRLVLVSLPDRKLAVIENGRVLRTFSVAVGTRVSPSPVGEFQVVSRVFDPAYYHAGVVIPPGKDNPIGPRWLGLNQKGYGIHGTNEPRSIGRAASHGCIRLRNRDIEQLFEMVRVGDVVDIRARRDDQTAQIFNGVPDRSVTVIAEARLSPIPADQRR